MPVMRLGDRIEIEDVESRVGEQCASVQGFSLHAGSGDWRPGSKTTRAIEPVHFAASDRQRAAPRAPRWAHRIPASTPLARWHDGRRHVVFEPTELIEKLAVLIPSPRSNALRYHGVFAPGSKWREAVTGIVRPRRLCQGLTPRPSRKERLSPPPTPSVMGEMAGASVRIGRSVCRDVVERSVLYGDRATLGPSNTGMARAHRGLAGKRGDATARSGVSRRPHTLLRTRRNPRKCPESLVGRQGLEPSPPPESEG